MDFSQILKLPIPERILLVEAIWDSIARERKQGAAYSLSPEQLTILEEELEKYNQNPKSGSSWEEVKQRIYKTK
jgi:putative addiction module component (TIGR02574 family)